MKHMGCGITLVVLAILVPLIWSISSSLREWFEGPSGNISGILLIAPFSIVCLIVGTVIIIRSRRGPKARESIKGEGEIFHRKTDKCPYCSNPVIESGILYQAKNTRENEILGYSKEVQKMCLKCKKKWIVLEI
jgi:hypothetical protein